MNDGILNLTGMTEPPPPVLVEISELLSKQKLVPFFGAGISRQHLGFAAAELAHELANHLGEPPDTLLSDLADHYEDRNGTAAFVALLRAKFDVKALDDSKAPIHRLLVSLGSNLLYTTNQDNIFELAAAHYGRPYRPVLTVDDLSEAIPGEPLLIKFHGDPRVPESLVFGTRSYQKRMEAQEHPLDLKLRVDLFGKRLLFIGYSLRDENIAKILATVRRAFNGNMPTSYLIAFEYDPSMQALNEEFGIQIIDPLKMISEPMDSATAFECVLKYICDRTIQFQVNRGLEDMFRGGHYNARMITEHEFDALERIVDNDPFATAVTAFRGLIDGAGIPTSMHERLILVFKKLSEHANPTSEEEMNALRLSLFNRHVPPVLAVQAVAFVMKACNRRPSRGGFDEFGAILCPALPDGNLPVAAAMAVAQLQESNEQITDNYRALATSWFQGYQDLNPEPRTLVETMIKAAWPGHLAASSPISRPRSPFRAKGFHQIKNDLMATLPKKLQKPKD